MKSTLKHLLFSAVAAVAFSAPASAAILTFNLDCVLNPASGSPCQAGPSFGTVKLTDLGANQVQLVVDVLNPDIKFRDLMLNLTPGFTDVLSSDGTNLTVSYNGFTISPYGGAFDLGETGGQGWSTGGSTPYTTTLSGVGAVLSASSFNVTDTLGNVYVGIHLQNIGSANGGNCTGDGTPCAPGVTGPGSLKVGGTFGSFEQTGNPVPEPGTMGLMGAALAGLGLLRLKRKK